MNTRDNDILNDCPGETRRDVPLSDFTTFQLGGTVPAVIICRRPEDLEATVGILLKAGRDFILIGGGSNLLASDSGIECAVIRYYCEQPDIQKDGPVVSVSAGTRVDDLALFAAERGLAGLNHMTGIPGTVGGAIVGNAGAFGRQISDTLKAVTLLSRTGTRRDVSVSDLGFSYRNSLLKDNGDIVLSAVFELGPAEPKALLEERTAILELRRQKHPDYRNLPTAGSFFRNIEPTSKAGKRQAAGWFLEQSGAKELQCGGAYVFDRHANIIVRNEDGTAQDVYDLAQTMASKVRDVFGVILEREVRLVGRFKGMPADVASVVW